MVSERRFQIDLPSVREKLVEYVSDQVMTAIERYTWTGNISELGDLRRPLGDPYEGEELRAPIAKLTKSESKNVSVLPELEHEIHHRSETGSETLPGVHNAVQ